MSLSEVDVLGDCDPANRDQFCPNCGEELARLAWVREDDETILEIDIEDQAHYGVKSMTVCFDCGETSKDWII